MKNLNLDIKIKIGKFSIERDGKYDLFSSEVFQLGYVSIYFKHESYNIIIGYSVDCFLSHAPDLLISLYSLRNINIKDIDY